MALLHHEFDYFWWPLHLTVKLCVWTHMAPSTSMGLNCRHEHAPTGGNQPLTATQGLPMEPISWEVWARRTKANAVRTLTWCWWFLRGDTADTTSTAHRLAAPAVRGRFPFYVTSIPSQQGRTPHLLNPSQVSLRSLWNVSYQHFPPPHSLNPSW